MLSTKVVVLVGGLAIKELLGIGRLPEAIDKTLRHDGVVYVPLPHPSGVSTWINALERTRSAWGGHWHYMGRRQPNYERRREGV